MFENMSVSDLRNELKWLRQELAESADFGKYAEFDKDTAESLSHIRNRISEIEGILCVESWKNACIECGGGAISGVDRYGRCPKCSLES